MHGGWGHLDKGDTRPRARSSWRREHTTAPDRGVSGWHRWRSLHDEPRTDVLRQIIQFVPDGTHILCDFLRFLATELVKLLDVVKKTVNIVRDSLLSVRARVLRLEDRMDGRNITMRCRHTHAHRYRSRGRGHRERHGPRGGHWHLQQKKINTSHQHSNQNAMENYPHIALTPRFSSTTRMAPSKCH